MSPKQIQALSLLLEGKSDSKVAEIISVDRNTIARWKKEPLFLEQYQTAHQEYMNVVQQRLKNLTTKAVNVCEEALDRGDTKVALELIRRVDKISERQEVNQENLPRIFVELVYPEHNYTVSAEELLKENQRLNRKSSE